MKSALRVIYTVLGLCGLPGLVYADWSHAVYIGAGGAWQSLQVNTNLNGIYIHNAQSQANFKSDQSLGAGNLLVGLANRNNNLYWALEADTYLTSQSTNAQSYESFATTTHSTQTKMPWRAEIDGILGYYFAPQWLAYGKLGATMGRLDLSYSATEPDGKVDSSANANTNLYGVVTGLGLQYDINSAWHAALEADYIDFANTSVSVPAVYDQATLPQPYTFQYQSKQYLAKATVSYSF